MKTAQDFSAQLKAYKQIVHELEESADAASVQAAITRLERLHFEPTLILPAPEFLSFSKADLLQEIDRVAALSEQDLQEFELNAEQDMQQVKLEQIGLLVYHFKLLLRLRKDDPEAWDEVDELYGDD